MRRFFAYCKRVFAKQKESVLISVFWLFFLRQFAVITVTQKEAADMFFVVSMAAIVVSVLATLRWIDKGSIGTGVKTALFMVFYYFSPF
ncbi:hypothetical protein SAEN111111_00845 [Saccharibacillus endophyticus]